MLGEINVNNMTSQFGYYIFCIVAFIVAFMLLKKLAGCLVKTSIMAIVLAVLAAIYYFYFA